MKMHDLTTGARRVALSPVRFAARGLLLFCNWIKALQRYVRISHGEDAFRGSAYGTGSGAVIQSLSTSTISCQTCASLRPMRFST